MAASSTDRKRARTARGPVSVRRLLLNPASLVYLALVAASVLFTVGVTLFAPGPDASFAGVWMFFATAPVSVVLLPVLPGEGWGMVLLLAVSALVQAAAVGAVYGALRGRRVTTARGRTV